jgi:hypothetical protein
MSNSSPTPSHPLFQYFPALAAALAVVLGLLHAPHNPHHGDIVFWVFVVLGLTVIISLMVKGRLLHAAALLGGVMLVWYWAQAPAIPAVASAPAPGIQFLDAGADWAKVKVLLPDAGPRKVMAFLASPDGNWTYAAPIPLGDSRSAGENTFMIRYGRIHWDYLQQYPYGDIEARIVSYDAAGKEWIHGTKKLPRDALSAR